MKHDDAYDYMFFVVPEGRDGRPHTTAVIVGYEVTSSMQQGADFSSHEHSCGKRIVPNL